MGEAMDDFDRQLLDCFQRDFPLCARPFAKIAAQIGGEAALTEAEAISRLDRLQGLGVIARIGATIETGSVGGSTLAAMRVPDHELETVAELVSSYPEVNHNYERVHRFNLWFVVTASSPDRVAEVVAEIQEKSGFPVFSLPMEESYRLDLGFRLSWP